MLKVLNIVGARPNFMKIAPIYREMKSRPDEFEPRIIHTGQHYDAQMSKVFFDDLQMPRPDVDLGVGSASHAIQTAKIMIAFEAIILEEKPDWVVVVGDVNSTIACSLVCSKLGIKVAHVEAGLRSFDRSMPEEINRILTDSISDLLLTPSKDGNENLKREGIPGERIRFVGNVMIDSLLHNLKLAQQSNIRSELGLPERYAVLTLHRPSNVDSEEALEPLLEALCKIASDLPIVFPAHPRTAQKLKETGLDVKIPDSGIVMTDPLGYLDFLSLMSGASLVLTDSGGLQEETTALSIPCLTLRENTERPITVELGTNQIVGVDPERILSAATELRDNDYAVPDSAIPPLWDGATAGRICDALLEK